MVGDRRGSGENRRLHSLGMVAARLQVSLLEPAARPDVIALFDREFIFSRGRTISLAQRFSDIFSSGDCFVAAGKLEDQLVSALTVRAFTWVDGEREWRGAMIGLVCTKLQYRGRGYAGQLLTAAEGHCRALGHDFAVLWAANPAIYQALGWIAADRGMLGTRRMPSGGAPPDPSATHETPIFRIHALHEARGSPRVRRQLANYRHLLPPAERLLFFLEGNSFALGGQHGRAGYVYELAGHCADMPRLWNSVAANFDDFYVNVERDSTAHCWLRTHTPLEWKAQALTMWKSMRSDRVPFQRWYIPVMDRI